MKNAAQMRPIHSVTLNVPEIVSMTANDKCVLPFVTGAASVRRTTEEIALAGVSCLMTVKMPIILLYLGSEQP